MQNQTQTALFTELSTEEATQANGGFLGALAGYAVGRAGSNWWYNTFVSNVRRGNYGGAIAATDRNVNALLRSLRGSGIRI